MNPVVPRPGSSRFARMLAAALITTALLAGTAAAQQAAPRAAAGGSCPDSLAMLYDQVSPAVVSIRSSWSASVGPLPRLTVAEAIQSW